MAGSSCSGFRRVSVNWRYLFQSIHRYPNTGRSVGIVVFGREREALCENSHVYYVSADVLHVTGMFIMLVLLTTCHRDMVSLSSASSNRQKANVGGLGEKALQGQRDGGGERWNWTQGRKGIGHLCTPTPGRGFPEASVFFCILSSFHDFSGFRI